MKKIKIIIISLLISHFVQAQNALLIPGVLSGTDINLTLQNGTYQFYDGINTTTMGVNGNILGPTLILEKGQQVNFTVNNNLNDTTTIHWHGMHVSSVNDGGPHTYILPGEQWQPSFEVMDKAGTYWYHPHLHRKTNKHVSLGIAGLILVKDDEEAALNLPRTYGIDDFPLVIQTKDFDADKQIVVPSNSDDVVMVNATIDPFLEVPAQVIRYRILNGSSMRVFNLGLSDDKAFYMIASDGGLLNAPISLTRLRLAPGERAEILIDFSENEGEIVKLMSYASEFSNGIYGATNPGMMASMTLNGYNPNPLNGADFDILEFNIVSPNENPIYSIPITLAEVNPIPESQADITRNLTFTPEVMGPDQLNGLFLINGTSFDMNVITYSIPLNNTEIWSIKNQSAISHPFHIHDVQFYVLDRNGNPPPLSEQGRKDVLLIKPQETIRFITKFEDFADDSIPYMFHCHMLMHEDGGMMLQFEVVDESNGIENKRKINDNFKIYPNPAHTNFRLINQKGKMDILSIEIWNAQGQSVYVPSTNTKKTIDVDVSSLRSGLYYVVILTSTNKIVKKLMIK